MNGGSVEFHIAEYNSLREHFLSNVRGAYSSVVYVSISNAFIVAWLASSAYNLKYKGVVLAICWIPLLLTAVGWTVAALRNAAIQRIVGYTKLIETKLSIDELGWERYMTQYSSRYRTRHVINFIFAVQLVLSIYFGAMFTLEFLF